MFFQEDEFNGFSFEELKAGEKKLNLFNKKEKKKETNTSGASEDVAYQRTVPGSTRRSIHTLPAPKQISGKIKNGVQKSSKKLVKESLDGVEDTYADDRVKSKHTPSHPASCAEKIKVVNPFDHKNKPKKFKLDYKHGLHDMSIPGPKAKKSDMDMAKFLLEKAKQANKIQEQAKARKLAAAKKHSIPVQKKEFVLPTQSSRSSRVIKPNKRFLEEDSFQTFIKKKSKAGAEPIESSPNSQQGEANRKRSTETFSPSFVDPSADNIGLLDQPLIVDGKRDRKPSLKLILSDNDFPPFSPTTSAITSPLAAPKLGTSLFSQSQFQKASEKQKFSMMSFGVSRLHGASIVQKAKLQLNRAALNKSKAALAKSLRAEMKREANYAEQAALFESDTSPPPSVIKPSKEKDAKGKSQRSKENISAVL